MKAQYKEFTRQRISTKLQGLSIDVSSRMRNFITSLPDLTETELKVRSTFFKGTKRGNRIEGLTHQQEQNQNNYQNQAHFARNEEMGEGILDNNVQFEEEELIFDN